MSVLHIPDVAYEMGVSAAATYVAESDALDVASDVLHAGAPLIVAAELRRIADEIEADVAEALRHLGPDESDGGAHDAAAVLRERADELDGGA